MPRICVQNSHKSGKAVFQCTYELIPVNRCSYNRGQALHHRTWIEGWSAKDENTRGNAVDKTRPHAQQEHGSGSASEASEHINRHILSLILPHFVTFSTRPEIETNIHGGVLPRRFGVLPRRFGVLPRRFGVLTFTTASKSMFLSAVKHRQRRPVFGFGPGKLKCRPLCKKSHTLKPKRMGTFTLNTLHISTYIRTKYMHSYINSHTDRFSCSSFSTVASSSRRFAASRIISCRKASTWCCYIHIYMCVCMQACACGFMRRCALWLWGVIKPTMAACANSRIYSWYIYIHIYIYIYIYTYIAHWAAFAFYTYSIQQRSHYIYIYIVI